VDIGFCWDSCCVVDNTEVVILVAFVVLSNNVGRVNAYTLTMIIRVTAGIDNRILLSNAVYTSQCHQGGELSVWWVIR
jgi:hypothetical protein